MLYDKIGAYCRDHLYAKFLQPQITRDEVNLDSPLLIEDVQTFKI